MFTGLIEEVGAVARRSGSDLAVVAKAILDDLAPGDSVAVNGACLTVAALTGNGFVAQMSPETLERTTLSSLRPGDAVNLERAMAAGARFGGHFVLGHVDGVGRIADIRNQGEFSLWRFQAPDEVARYLVPKGSVAVDGISLAVVEPAGDTFGVAVIPTTAAKTNLGGKRPGDAVNIEADVIGKHVYHYLKGASGTSITRDFLARHGFA
ncbi:MAG TPA: riboflavin synthase [Candidatus Hydrogenedentes bacterium]|nr:riboflavin synthase [Candidatus Hydrogenedentota bacterium]